MSCWTALQSFLKSLPTLERESRVRMVAFFDHEEVGYEGKVFFFFFFFFLFPSFHPLSL